MIKKVQHYVATIYAQYLIAYADHIVKEKLQSAFSETPGVSDKYKENPAFQEICTMYLHMVAKDHKNVPLAKKLIDDILSDPDLQSALTGDPVSLRRYLSKNYNNQAFINNLPEIGKEKRFEDNKKTYQNQG